MKFTRYSWLPRFSVYIISARYNAEEVNIRMKLKETDEPPLHLSVVQHETPQSSPLSSQAFLTTSQASAVVHVIATEWRSKAVACVLWQVPSGQSTTYLASSASNFDFKQTFSSSSAEPICTQV